MFNKPILIFDVETTGLDIWHDRIIQFACLRIEPDGKQKEFHTLLCPETPISEEAQAVHGISNEDVKAHPPFSVAESQIYVLVKDAILSGFNVRNFDWPILKNEFQRAGTDIEEPQIIDVLEIYQRMVNSKLSSVFRHYMGKPMENAHDARADVLATFECLRAQILEYDLPKTSTDFENWLKTPQGDNVDPEGKFIWKGKDIVCNFGKNKGVKLKEMEANYLNWIISGKFSKETKRIARMAFGIIPKNQQEVMDLFNL